MAPHSKSCACFSALVNKGLSESDPVAVSELPGYPGWRHVRHAR